MTVINIEGKRLLQKKWTKKNGPGTIIKVLKSEVRKANFCLYMHRQDR
jgi:hypothetical protein